jgi:hypothetical protein
MIAMPRASVLATLLLAVLPLSAARQEPGVLRVRIVLADAAQRATPVARHALLVSDNPATAEPRRVLTGADGSVELRLRPGSYIVESDRPFAFEGQGYQWTQVVQIAAGRDTLLELNAANAELTAAPAADTPTPAADDSSLLSRYQDSVVALWSPTLRASGFVVDARGLIATSQRVVGTAATVEVQLTPLVKVAASVVASDAARDVAVVRVNPASIAALRPVPTGCPSPPKPPPIGQELVALEAPIRYQKDTTSGTVTRLQAPLLLTDLGLVSGGVGGPVFDVNGRFVGLTSILDPSLTQYIDDIPVVPAAQTCDVIAAAVQQLAGTPAAAEVKLPVEPTAPFPEAALKEGARRRAGNLLSYQTSSTEFDVTFLTPILVYAGQERPQATARQGPGGSRAVELAAALSSPLLNFSNWSEYVAEIPPVLLVRATPKQTEGFWFRVARGAAMTKGIAIPPIKRFRSGFSRLRAYCGEQEVTPIHPLKLERRISETDAVYEGLYVFAPDALTPACGSVKLLLYSDKTPEAGVSHVVPAKLLEVVAEDFAAYHQRRP